jgi:hypothetical protein
MAKDKWIFHSSYKGCVIESRPGLLRRGWRSIYHNWHYDGRVSSFVHHSLENAQAHIDKLHRDLGDGIAISDGDYVKWQVV